MSGDVDARRRAPQSGSPSERSAALGPDRGLLIDPTSGLPYFDHTGVPRAEPGRQKRRIHVLAVAAIVVSVLYLAWRVTFTIAGADLFVAVPLYGMEILQLIGFSLYVVALWDLDPVPGWRPVRTADHRVAVLIPTYNESREILLPVVAAAVAIGPEHETWVLDDGRRPEVRDLAEALGARYLERPDNRHAKAGNVNHALQFIDAEILAIVDADHVVLPDFLHHTLGYFDDPDIAVVQTPQEFYNVDSFEHTELTGARLYNEQQLFYRAIMPAKNRWNAVFWCGTNAVVRRSALDAVGGIATGSITEDIHTSLRLHKGGWRIVAHNEVLARGLAATDAAQYLLQRDRWGRGAMQVLKQERIFGAQRLTFAQKLAYGSTIYAWFDAWRSLGWMLLPVLVVVTGGVPIYSPIWSFGPAFLAAFVMQYAAFRMLARGYFPPFTSIMFSTLRMPAGISATIELIKPGGRTFKVTPKGRVDDRYRVRLPRLFTGSMVVMFVALAWFLLTVVGLTPLHYGNRGAMIGAAFFLAANLGLVVVASQRVVSDRFAGERRASVRFPVDLPALIDDRPCRLADLSLTGMRVAFAGEREIGPGTVVRLDIPRFGIDLKAAAMRTHRRSRETTVVGFEFDHGQFPKIAAVALTLFHGNPGAFTAHLDGRCHHCERTLIGRQRKWCSNACRMRERRRRVRLERAIPPQSAGASPAGP